MMDILVEILGGEDPVACLRLVGWLVSWLSHSNALGKWSEEEKK